ncbi:hypothetical protein M0813_11194 [Anaeramoeba flamelloides]|uniref:Uncharacterized protein n=1 Tax=Anaeramoeba flamelloides TaxID=1746091 RepID=A0ABQ8ZFG4_9EUKA|nr:hypothetical protein M0813_11194 [Anaeramoeba flamelloides]
MSSLATIPQNKREQLVSDFTLELGCERSEALKYLSCGNFDYSSSLGLFILTKLLSTKRNNNKNTQTRTFLRKNGCTRNLTSKRSKFRHLIRSI